MQAEFYACRHAGGEMVIDTVSYQTLLWVGPAAAKTKEEGGGRKEASSAMWLTLMCPWQPRLVLTATVYVSGWRPSQISTAHQRAVGLMIAILSFTL